MVPKKFTNIINIQNRNNMIQVITREWEVTKTYIFEVVLRDGLIRLDWHDFEMKAQESRPAVAVKADEPLGISEMTAKAIEEIKKNINGTLSCVMLVISCKKDKELMMEELGGMSDSLSRLADENVDIFWGVQLSEQITNDRSVTVFAFEK